VRFTANNPAGHNKTMAWQTLCIHSGRPF
jgi:hypothetical protein